MGMILESIVSSVWPYVLGILALVAGWFTAHQTGKRRGREEAEIENLQRSFAQVSEARNVENETAAMSDDAISDDLKSNWVRK